MTDQTPTGIFAETTDAQELTRLRNLTVAQARELAMMRWELTSMVRQMALAGKVHQVKHDLLRRYPGPIHKLAQLKRRVVNRLAGPPASVVQQAERPLGQSTVLLLSHDEAAAEWARARAPEDTLFLEPATGYTRSLTVGLIEESPLRLPTAGSFGKWLIDDPARLRQVGTILVEAGDEVSLSLLKGRLVEGQKLAIFQGGDQRSDLVGELTVARQDGSVALVETFPADWLDPLDARFRPVAAIVAKRSWPKISVVMVSFNQADYLEEGLRSILDQGYPNLEFIVIDGASTDGSVDILERYRSRLDVLVIERDKGQSDGLNKGFGRTTGEIVTWVNSDDLLEPGALFRVAQTFTANKVDVVTGGCRQIGLTRDTILVNHHNRLPFGLPIALPLGLILDMERFWLTGHFFFQPEVFFTRDIWMRAGGRLRTDLNYIMDYDLWVRLAAAGAQVSHIPEFLACSRTHDKQKTVAGMPFMPEVQRLLAEYGSRLIPPPPGSP
jgi:hypothetical protein